MRTFQTRLEVLWVQQALTMSLVILCVFGAFGVPEIVVSKYSLPVPGFLNWLPYAAPVLFCALIAISAIESPGRFSIVIGRPEILFLSLLTLWLGIECFHSLTLGQAISFSFILPHVWMFLFYYLYRRALEHKSLQYAIYLSTLTAVYVICIMQYLMYLYIIPGQFVQVEAMRWLDRPQGLHLNITSYIAVVGIWLLLFIPPPADTFLRARVVVPSLFLFILLILFNRTLGAILLTLGLLSLFYYQRSSQQVRIILLVAATLALLGLLATSIFFFRSGGIPLSSLLAHVDSISASQRIGGIMVSVDRWLSSLSSILIGWGGSSENSFRYEGMLSHTYYTRVLSAYGLVGLTIMALSMLSMFRTETGSYARQTFSGIMLLIGVMAFEPYLHWWYAIIPSMALLGMAQSPRRGVSNIGSKLSKTEYVGRT